MLLELFGTKTCCSPGPTRWTCGVFWSHLSRNCETCGQRTAICASPLFNCFNLNTFSINLPLVQKNNNKKNARFSKEWLNIIRKYKFHLESPSAFLRPLGMPCSALIENIFSLIYYQSWATITATVLQFLIKFIVNV